MRPPTYCLRHFQPITTHSVARWQPSRHSNNHLRRCTRTHVSNSSGPSSPQPTTSSRGTIPLFTAIAAALTTGTALFVAQAQAATKEAVLPTQPNGPHSGPLTLETLHSNENIVQVLSKQSLLAEEVPLLDADHMVLKKGSSLSQHHLTYMFYHRLQSRGGVIYTPRLSFRPLYGLASCAISTATMTKQHGRFTLSLLWAGMHQHFLGCC